MSNLDYLGGALENFYEGDKENPHLIERNVTVKENGKIVAKGSAADIKDILKDKYDRKIVEWDAYFNMVTLTI